MERLSKKQENFFKKLSEGIFIPYAPKKKKTRKDYE